MTTIVGSQKTGIVNLSSEAARKLGFSTGNAYQINDPARQDYYVVKEDPKNPYSKTGIVHKNNFTWVAQEKAIIALEEMQKAKGDKQELSNLILTKEPTGYTPVPFNPDYKLTKEPTRYMPTPIKYPPRVVATMPLGTGEKRMISTEEANKTSRGTRVKEQWEIDQEIREMQQKDPAKAYVTLVGLGAIKAGESIAEAPGKISEDVTTGNIHGVAGTITSMTPLGFAAQTLRSYEKGSEKYGMAGGAAIAGGEGAAFTATGGTVAKITGKTGGKAKGKYRETKTKYVPSTKVEINPDIKVILDKMETKATKTITDEKGNTIREYGSGEGEIKSIVDGKHKSYKIKAETFTDETGTVPVTDSRAIITGNKEKILITEKASSIIESGEIKKIVSIGKAFEIVERNKLEKIMDTQGIHTAYKVLEKPEGQNILTEGIILTKDTKGNTIPTVTKGLEEMNIMEIKKERAGKERATETVQKGKRTSTLTDKEVVQAQRGIISETAKAIIEAKEHARASTKEIIQLPEWMETRKIAKEKLKPETVRMLSTKQNKRSAQRQEEREKTEETKERQKNKTSEKAKSTIMVKPSRRIKIIQLQRATIRQKQDQKQEELTKIKKQEGRNDKQSIFAAFTETGRNRQKKKKTMKEDDEDERERNRKPKKAKWKYVQDPLYNITGKRKYKKKMNLLKAQKLGNMFI